MTSVRRIGGVLVEAGRDWLDDNAARMGAALAFYSLLSLAPLLLVVLAVAGLFFDEAEARRELLQQMSHVVGREGAVAIRQMVDSGTETGRTAATAFGIVMLLFGASGVFGELQSSLNAVWDVEPRPAGLASLLKARFLSFAMVLGTGFLLVVSLILSTAMASLQGWAGNVLPQVEPLWQTLSSFGTFVLVTFLFALIYKTLPDTEIAWRDVWAGALLTSLLFHVGKVAIGMYLGQSGLASAYGAASSLVVLIVWVYYSAQVLIFGAELTHVLSGATSPRGSSHGVP